MNKAEQIENSIRQIKKDYEAKKIDGQTAIDKVHNLRDAGLSIHMSIDNYLYRNGILNKATAILSAKENIKKFHLFKDCKQKFAKELKIIENSKQNWFENYGIHDSPYHDLIKLDLDSWKVTGLLNSLICDLYVGTYNEGSTKDLMKE